MHDTVRLLILATVCLIAAAALAQQPASDRSWAFPMKPDRAFPEDSTPKSLPGSAKTYTQAQVDVSRPASCCPADRGQRARRRSRLRRVSPHVGAGPP